VLSILQTGNLLNALPGDRPSIKNVPSAGTDVGKPLPVVFAHFLAKEDAKGTPSAQSESTNTVIQAKGETFSDRHIANKRRGADPSIASTPTPAEANYLEPRSLWAPPQQSAEEIDKGTEAKPAAAPKQPAPNGPMKQTTSSFTQLPQLPALSSEFHARIPPAERSIVQGTKFEPFPKANEARDEFGGAQIPSSKVLSRAEGAELIDRPRANKSKDNDPRITVLLSQVQPSYFQPRLLWAPPQLSGKETDGHADVESTVIGGLSAPDSPIKETTVAFTGILQASAPAPEFHAQTLPAEQAIVQPSQAAKDITQASADLPRHGQSSTDTSGHDQSDLAGKGTPDARMIVPLLSKQAPAHDQSGERVQAPLVAPISAVSIGGQQQHTSSEPRSIDRSESGEKVADLPEPPRSAPPSTIRLQVPITHEGNEQGHVDIRVSQRASTVLVSVGTEDADLAQSLRRHLPELTEQLAQNGIDSTFAGKQVSPAQHTPPTGRHNNDGPAHDQDAPRQYRESRQGEAHSEDRRGRQGRSLWLEELTTPDRR
jgi:hypothetical protein